MAAEFVSRRFGQWGALGGKGLQLDLVEREACSGNAVFQINFLMAAVEVACRPDEDQLPRSGPEVVNACGYGAVRLLRGGRYLFRRGGGWVERPHVPGAMGHGTVPSTNS